MKIKNLILFCAFLVFITSFAGCSSLTQPSLENSIGGQVKSNALGRANLSSSAEQFVYSVTIDRASEVADNQEAKAERVTVCVSPKEYPDANLMTIIPFSGLSRCKTAALKDGTATEIRGVAIGLSDQIGDDFKKVCEEWAEQLKKKQAEEQKNQGNEKDKK